LLGYTVSVCLPAGVLLDAGIDDDRRLEAQGLDRGDEPAGAGKVAASQVKERKPVHVLDVEPDAVPTVGVLRVRELLADVLDLGVRRIAQRDWWVAQRPERRQRRAAV